MKALRFLISLGFILLNVVACSAIERSDNKKTTTPEQSTQKNNTSTNFPSTTWEQELQYFPEIKEIIEQNPCIKSNNCNTETISSGIAELKQEQILILEDINYPYSGFHRYRDRISGYYLRTLMGDYKRMYPKAQVSKVLLKIIDVLNRNTKVTSQMMPALGRFLHMNSQVEILGEDLGRLTHAVDVFEFAIDRNPDANFIFADNPLISKENLCTILENPKDGFKRFSEQLDISLKSLSAIIQTNQVKYINMSFAPSIASTVKHMEFFCNKSNRKMAERIVDYYNQFYLNLLELNKEIILVQAVPNDIQGSYKCPFDRRWIRVGYVNEINSQISPEGDPLTDDRIPLNLAPLSECITTAINGGFIDRKNFDSNLPDSFNENSLYYNYFGLFAYPVDIMATSWATPLALSYIRAHDERKSPLEIYLTVRGRILDPIKNRQFMESSNIESKLDNQNSLLSLSPQTDIK